MVPIGETFSRFRRVVRDTATRLGKDVALELQGGETELDKSVVERIADPLMHLVRNALDHGLETPESAWPPASRRRAGWCCRPATRRAAS
jgi:two-component system chemotaxis sensor kinase CheA